MFSAVCQTRWSHRQIEHRASQFYRFQTPFFVFRSFPTAPFCSITSKNRTRLENQSCNAMTCHRCVILELVCEWLTAKVQELPKTTSLKPTDCDHFNHNRTSLQRLSVLFLICGIMWCRSNSIRSARVSGMSTRRRCLTSSWDQSIRTNSSLLRLREPANR